MNNKTLHLPQDLVEAWNYARSSADKKMSQREEKKFEDIWCTLQKKLAKNLTCSKVPGISGEDEALDAASDFLANLFTGPSPDHIASISFLVQQMRKFLAKKRNPVQYELNNILRNALLTLEKRGEVKREQGYRGEKITNKTRFALIDIDSSEQLTAQRDDYEFNKLHGKNFFIASHKNTGKNIERKRLVAPSDAMALTVYLLETFKGWTKLEDLQWAMPFHIAETLQIVPLYTDSDSENAVPIEKGINEDYAYGFELQQQNLVCNEMSSRVWEKICKISDKVFCLYYLPKELFGQKGVTLSSLGPTSTVGDQKDKIAKIFFAERFNLELYNDESHKQHYRLMLGTMNKILQDLQGRCTEKGYSPSLNNSEDQQ